MKDNNIVSWVGSAVTLVTAGLSQDVMQIILMIIGIISALVSLAYNIYKWYKRATADGKIDEGEIDELKDIVDDATKKGVKQDEPESKRDIHKRR